MEALQDAFDQADVDRNGRLDRDAIIRLLGTFTSAPVARSGGEMWKWDLFYRLVFGVSSHWVCICETVLTTRRAASVLLLFLLSSLKR